MLASPRAGNIGLYRNRPANDVGGNNPVCERCSGNPVSQQIGEMQAALAVARQYDWLICRNGSNKMIESDQHILIGGIQRLFAFLPCQSEKPLAQPVGIAVRRRRRHGIKCAGLTAQENACASLRFLVIQRRVPVVLFQKIRRWMQEKYSCLVLVCQFRFGFFQVLLAAKGQDFFRFSGCASHMFTSA